MKGIHSKNILEYNQRNKTFCFSCEHDYLWSKAVIKNISLSLYLEEQPIKPFQLVCSDAQFSLTLKGLTDNDEQRFIDLFKLNGFDLRIKTSNVANKDFFCLFGYFFGKKLSYSSPEETTLLHKQPTYLSRPQQKF